MGLVVSTKSTSVAYMCLLRTQVAAALLPYDRPSSAPHFASRDRVGEDALKLLASACTCADTRLSVASLMRTVARSHSHSHSEALVVAARRFRVVFSLRSRCTYCHCATITEGCNNNQQ